MAGFQDFNPSFGTEVYSIIDPKGNGDYSTLQTWESSEQRDLVAASEIEVALCRRGGNLLGGSSLSIIGWRANGRDYPEIRGDDGHHHQGVWDTSKAYCEAQGGGGPALFAIRLTETAGLEQVALRISRMQVRLSTAGGTNSGQSTILGDDLNDTVDHAVLQVDRSIIVNRVNNTDGACIEIEGGSLGIESDGLRAEHMITSSLIISNKATASRNIGIQTELSGTQAPRIRAYNNTIVASGGVGFNQTTSASPFDRIVSQNNLIIADTPYSDARFDSNPTLSGIFGKFRDGLTGSDTGGNPAGHNPALVGLNIFDHVINPTSDEETADWHLKYNSPLAGSGFDMRAAHFLPNNASETPYAGFMERHINFDIDSIPIVPGSGGTFTAGSGGIFPVGADIPNLDGGPAHIGGYLSAEQGTIVLDAVGGWVEGISSLSESAEVGAFIQGGGIPGQSAIALVGGFTSGFAFQKTPESIGGYVNALPLQGASGFNIGSYLNSYHLEGPRSIGGFVWGTPGYSEYVEMHGRTLAKANSEDTVDQGLNIDAQMVFIQRANSDFNANFDVANTTRASFNAKLTVGKYKLPPFVFINSVTPGSGLPGASGIEVCVVASGNLRDGTQWVINQIDFGEPFRDSVPTVNNSISGFDLGNQTAGVWSGCYTYRDPGVYVITARGVDNLGMVGMDHYILNLASGLTAGTDYPLISISGTPRLGEVPPSLTVDFALESSGVFSPRTPTDSNLFWNFGNLARSNTVNPFTYYSSPGLYLPTARFRVQVSGQWRWGADTLRVGFNF